MNPGDFEMTKETEALEAIRAMLPTGICLTNRNIRDDMEVPMTTTMGELRAFAAAVEALSRPTGQGGDVGEAVAWIKPDWQNPATFDGLSPVTTYRRAGWLPLYLRAGQATTADALLRAIDLHTDEEGEVWLTINEPDVTGQGAIRVGGKERIVSQCLLLWKTKRDAHLTNQGGEDAR